MKKISLAIVGTGIIGEKIINQLQHHEQVEIIALFDQNNERLLEIANTYQLFAASSYEEVLQLKPDWVYIGTPPITHASLSLQAIAEGLNVLCEKPLAHDVEDSEHMVKAATKSGALNAMHFPLMYSPTVRHFMKLIEKKTIGEPIRIELQAYFTDWPRAWQQNSWIASREQGGFIREVFPHFLQLMYRMFGRLTIRQHQTIFPDDETLAETSVMALGETVTNIPFLLNGLAGIGQQEDLSLIVYGTEGVLKLCNWSELSMAQKNSPFEILTSFDPVPSIIDECILALSHQEAMLVHFEEGLEVQRLINQLLHN
ncbi:Gfo/Idh/MocA family protein [Sporosarcina sp. HYO08]|uniref:Gfo/Idh/MocA family protein n=1 Tax=Sporosarcina sp. HYO08 TaxID=1759557 RepID=UPI00079C580C|nr:Gfo/Idh/MocA family oxidoreductase [Sporosarcina sp. HYO08]KXH79812.1 dehydrogenase [Sporosarcina sp. HYO08]